MSRLSVYPVPPIQTFPTVLPSGFAAPSAESTFYAPYPFTEESDILDDYDYASDSDLEDESGANYDDWEVEIPQPRIVRQNIAPLQSNSASDSSSSSLAVSEPQAESPVYEEYEEEEDRGTSPVLKASEISQPLMAPQATDVLAECCNDTCESGPEYFSGAFLTAFRTIFSSLSTASPVQEAMTPQSEEFIGCFLDRGGSPVYRNAYVPIGIQRYISHCRLQIVRPTLKVIPDPELRAAKSSSSTQRF